MLIKSDVFVSLSSICSLISFSLFLSNRLNAVFLGMQAFYYAIIMKCKARERAFLFCNLESSCLISCKREILFLGRHPKVIISSINCAPPFASSWTAIGYSEVLLHPGFQGRKTRITSFHNFLIITILIIIRTLEFNKKKQNSRFHKRNRFESKAMQKKSERKYKERERTKDRAGTIITKVKSVFFSF